MLWLLGLLVDAAVLMVIIRVLQGDDAAEFMDMIFVILGISVANGVCMIGLGSFIGFFALIPALVIDWLILLFFCGLTIKQTTITLGVFVAYKVLFSVTMELLF